MNNNISLNEEEARRDRNTDPLERWNAILQTIEFAEAQHPVKRNSKEACLEKQAILNHSLLIPKR
jgi:hypothetical protein